jgi:hypothetical protein
VTPQSSNLDEEVRAVVGNSDSNREGLGPDDVISVYKAYQRVSTGGIPTCRGEIGIRLGRVDCYVGG